MNLEQQLRRIDLEHELGRRRMKNVLKMDAEMWAQDWRRGKEDGVKDPWAYANACFDRVFYRVRYIRELARQRDASEAEGNYPLADSFEDIAEAWCLGLWQRYERQTWGMLS